MFPEKLWENLTGVALVVTALLGPWTAWITARAARMKYLDDNNEKKISEANETIERQERSIYRLHGIAMAYQHRLNGDRQLVDILHPKLIEWKAMPPVPEVQTFLED